MYRILVILIFIVGTTHQVVHSNPFNSKDWWSRLVYEQTANEQEIAATDTSIIVVSNRYKTDDPLRFMSETTGDGTMMYFFVYAHGGQWHVLQTEGLDEAISYIPNKHKDMVVYTEGMGKIFTSELDRGMMMASQYNVNVIMLDYPSITTTKSLLGNYKFSIRNARHAYKYHLPVLEQIKEDKLSGELGDGKLTLFFHSMGNYLIEEIFLHDKEKPLNDTKWVDNLMLNASCIPERKHADWLADVRFAKNIYVEYNTEDHVLKGAMLASFKRQLGNGPRYPIVTAAHYANFHSIVGEGHSYFLNLAGREHIHEIAKAYYSMALHGHKVDFNELHEMSEKYYGASVYPLRPSTKG